MKKENIFRLRFLFVAVFLLAVYLYAAVFLAPAMDDATGSYQFHEISYPLVHLSFYWTDTEQSIFGPQYLNARLLGISLDSGRYGTVNPVAVALVITIPVMLIGMCFGFLLPVLRAAELPAMRKLGWPQKVVCALCWGLLGLSALCIVLSPDNGSYHSFESLDFAMMSGTASQMGQPSPLGFVVVFVLGSFLALVLFQFMQRRWFQYWILERMSFWLVCASGTLLFFSVILAVGRHSYWYMDDSKWNAGFLASSVFLGAAGARLGLMFHYHKFVKAQAMSGEHVCIACGYDLRGSLGRSSCPECGARITVNESTEEMYRTSEN